MILYSVADLKSDSRILITFPIEKLDKIFIPHQKKYDGLWLYL